MRSVPGAPRTLHSNASPWRAFSRRHTLGHLLCQQEIHLCGSADSWCAGPRPCTSIRRPSPFGPLRTLASLPDSCRRPRPRQVRTLWLGVSPRPSRRSLFTRSLPSCKTRSKICRIVQRRKTGGPRVSEGMAGGPSRGRRCSGMRGDHRRFAPVGPEVYDRWGLSGATIHGRGHCNGVAAGQQGRAWSQEVHPQL